MGSGSFSFKLRSHPDKLLVDHLRNVGEMCRRTVAESARNLENAEILAEVAYIIGATHDLGKATEFFQEYLMETDERRKRALRSRDTTKHGLLSSLFTYAAVREHLRKRRCEMSGTLPVVSFIAVKRHHGDLANALDEISEIYAERERILSVVEEQLSRLERNECQQIFRALLGDVAGGDFDSLVGHIPGEALKDLRHEKRLLRDIGKKDDMLMYFVAQLLYSALLDADKTDAGLEGVDLRRVEIPCDLVDRYREARGFSESSDGINGMRNEIYRDAVDRISGWDMNERIISLNVPTGTGKTLTSLAMALRLRSRLMNEYGIMPRIVYALPFLSIIDQTCDVFEDVLECAGIRADSSVLLKHHHLSDIAYTRGDEEYEPDVSLLLMEGWNSEIVVTTFWQLFHTIFSNKNRRLRKFSRLVNSIVILDEVQAVPHRYWLLIHDAMRMLCERFNSYLILVTATQPLIFNEEDGEIREAVSDKERYFRALNRVELHPMIDAPMSLEDFVGLLARELHDSPEKDLLVVLNTIRSARNVYRAIKSLDLEETELFYLSTHVVPRDRMDRIRRIRERRDGGCRKVIVSTQLIEAGVDIDADIVFRDLAPLDSINQVAGRCNRNLSKERGRVSIVMLRDERRELCRYIYDGFLISKTLDMLRSCGKCIEEREILELNRRYFKAVRSGMSDVTSRKCMSMISGLAFEDLGKRFRLIEEDEPRVDVFVEVDLRASEVWQMYRALRSERDIWERRRRYLSIRNELSDYVISLPKRIAANLVTDDQGIGYISMDELTNYYDPETGFRVDDAGEGSMII
ncbi:MAG: CRISPR-associated helicase Cas3' [Methanothrix sp.]|nr:CRISPR-associated helicase Cas3' [Methanothrix sp.]MCQ8903781.1 CRISPR-associated helicase Cas3' [Methanothrix sp.]